MKNKLKKGLVWGMILSLTLEATPVWALSKDETIYAKLNSDGSIKSSTVSEHLSDDGNSTITDKSSLLDITNVNGDETYTKDGDKIVWETNGKDIYYQGSSDEELPIDISVTYSLDDKEMDVNDMIGKSGSVKIVLKYNNNLEKVVKVNGKNETLYVPFVVATTSIISNSENKNIKVTNGKVIDNGVNSVIVALSSPGLYESLDIDELEDFDTVEISYETECFELSSIYSVATNKLFSESDLDVFDEVDKLYDSIDTLSDSSTMLVNGSKELLSAIKSQIGTGNTLSDEELESIRKMAVSGATLSEDDVAKEVSELLKNYELSHSDVNEIIKDALSSINLSDEEKAMLVKQIVKAIEGNTDNIKEAIQNASKNFKLTDGQKQTIANTIVSKLSISDEQIELISKKAALEALEEVKNSQEYKSAVAAKEAYEKAGIENIINICTSDDVSKEYYSTCVSQIDNIANYKSLVASIKAMESTTESVASSVASSVATQINEQMATQISNYLSDEMISEITSSIADNISANLEDIIAEYVTEENVSVVLDNVLVSLNNYIQNDMDITISEEVLDTVNQKIADLAKEELTPILNSITKEVASKVSTEVAGNVADQVKDATLTSVSDNLSTLVEGLEKFDTEGIQKITDFVNGDVKEIEAKVEALVNLSEEYQTLDDLADGTEGSSKIIYIIDSIKEEKVKESTEEAQVEDKSLWQKIKGLFSK